jgi:hypothetical protein
VKTVGLTHDEGERVDFQIPALRSTDHDEMTPWSQKLGDDVEI